MKIMKQCKSCSKEFPFNAKCCPECGAINLIEKADKVNIMKQCKKCSKDFSINNHFCPGCGAMNPISKMAAGLGVIVLILGFIIVAGVASGNVTLIQEVPQSTIVENKPEDNVPASYKSALEKAKKLSEITGISKARVRMFLALPHDGRKFSTEAVQYAVDNLEVDWKEKALEKAKGYPSYMSPSVIYDNLVSVDVNFTPEEAQYAIDNLEQ